MRAQSPEQTLAEWFREESDRIEGTSDRYIVCAGLAILEAMKSAFPLSLGDYLTPKNQVKKTGGPSIAGILKTFGEFREYAKEGGRTTRGTRPAAERLAQRLNALNEIALLIPPERALLV